MFSLICHLAGGSAELFQAWNLYNDVCTRHIVFKELCVTVFI